MHLVPAPSPPRTASAATREAEARRGAGAREVASRAPGAALESRRGAFRYRTAAALAASWLIVIGCGSSAADGALEEPTGCVTTDECAVGQVCEAGACVESVVIVTRNAGEHACSVMSCPPGASDCCSTAAAIATGNRRQDYETNLRMVREADSNENQVWANFWFDAPNQQGWLTFELAEEMDLSRLSFYGWREGVADRFLSVNTNQADGGGCAYGFEIGFVPNPNPTPQGSAFVPGIVEVSFDNGDFCYDGGQPGRASEIAFAVFATQPGPASLVISNIRLSSE